MFILGKGCPSRQGRPLSLDRTRRTQREKAERRLGTSQALISYYLVKCLVPKTAESVCVMWRPWRGHFRYTIWKENTLKLVINLTRLPRRHGGGQCDRRETRMVGENQLRDQEGVERRGSSLSGGCLEKSGKSEHQVGENEKGTPFVFLHVWFLHFLGVGVTRGAIVTSWFICKTPA